MTEEHLTIANALGIQSFIIINKIDLIKQADRIEKISLQIQTAIDRSQKRVPIKHVLSEEEAVEAAHSIGQVLPVFSVSNVTGENLNLLTNFLNVLPNRNVFSAGSDTDASPLFYIDEIFNLPEVDFS
jgi:elongation factor 1-alpha